MTPESVSFDRVADRYDEHRGGLARGERMASALRAHLAPGSPVLEVGIGTGAVAHGMRALGFGVFGIDIAPRMAARALERIGARVACADGARLPFARVLRPGSIYVDIPDSPGFPDPITHATADMERTLSSRLWAEPKERRVAELAPAAGFEVLDIRDGEPFTWSETPSEAIARVESRPYSYLWDLPDAVWDEHVAPALDRLRALPNEPVERTARDRLVVMRRA